MDEHSHQVLLFEWANLQLAKYPELAFFHAIPNGAKLPYKRDNKGQRYSNQSRRLIAEGLTRGVPDTCLPAPRGKYHGLYLELKSEKGTPTPEQKKFIQFLNSHGYFACFAYGFDSAREVLEWYLNLPCFGQPTDETPPSAAVVNPLSVK